MVGSSDRLRPSSAWIPGLQLDHLYDAWAVRSDEVLVPGIGVSAMGRIPVEMRIRPERCQGPRMAALRTSERPKCQLSPSSLTLTSAALIPTNPRALAAAS